MVEDTKTPRTTNKNVSTIASKWADFQLFLWNKERKEVAGRTARSWAEITLFFIVLYVCLAVFWVGLLYLVQLRLPSVENGPLYSDYLTHRGPGLHVIPPANAIGRDKQKVYFYDEANQYKQNIYDFISEHSENDGKSDDSRWDLCDEKRVNGSWDEYKPCFFFYLNAVHNFVPQPPEEDGTVTIQCKPAHSENDGKSDDSRWDLCDEKRVNGSWDEYKPCFFFYLNAVHNFVPQPPEEDGTVTIQCKPAKPKYEKFFLGSHSFPKDGFNLDKFPWKYGMDWMREAPVVVVQIELNKEEMEKKEEDARIVCSAIAKNIYLDSEKPNIGSVDFRIRLP
ncbi:sodium/potassium-transporting ATPase subunit beta-1-like [Symsagittifera roscoffensis]|uniref:sodium/potassium-transporting ATPase subunit beta-1-like n=1 Tax=Symsagittifera roscoffensis TaxID=84072 RepID=UPI00307C4ED1